MIERDHGEQDGGDPTRIRSLAVTTDDLIAALEARLRAGRPTVLRVTPPFAGRMRARLHVNGTEGDYAGDPGDATPIHLDPRAFLDGDPPPYPGAGGPAAGGAVDARDAAAAWRESVRDALVDEIAVDTPGGPHRVAVNYLG